MHANASNGGKTSASRRTESRTQTVTIHVVCRECPHEQLVDGHTRDRAVANARTAQLTHAIETGHTRTVPGVVEDPSCHVCGRVPLLTVATGPEASDATHDCGHTPEVDDAA